MFDYSSYNEAHLPFSIIATSGRATFLLLFALGDGKDSRRISWPIIQ